MNNRSFLREVIIKILYQSYVYDNASIEYELKDLIKEQLEIENEFVNKAVVFVKDNQKSIDDLSNKYLKDWSVDRLSKVDKAIFSLAIYEMLNTDTPSIVVINEALELSKKYSDDKVVKMLNACLDKVYHHEVLHE